MARQRLAQKQEMAWRNLHSTIDDTIEEILKSEDMRQAETISVTTSKKPVQRKQHDLKWMPMKYRKAAVREMDNVKKQVQDLEGQKTEVGKPWAGTAFWAGLLLLALLFFFMGLHALED